MCSTETQTALPYNPAISLFIAFAIGIILDRFLNLDWLLLLGLAFSFILFWLIAYFACWKISGLAILLAISFAAAFWHHGRWNWFPEHDLASYCSQDVQPICVKARVLCEGKLSRANEDDPFDAIPKTDRTIFEIRPLLVRNGFQWENVDGRTRLVVHDKLINLDCGDEIIVYGKLAKFSAPTTPGNFDLRSHYRADQQMCALHSYLAESVHVIRESGFSNTTFRSSIRDYFDRCLQGCVGYGQAGFSSAILLGNREQIPRDSQSKFLTTGTAHLLAISGLHVGILAGFFLFLYRLGVIRRDLALWSTILFVCSYAWLVEFRPPVVRAAILLTLYCLGRLVGRRGVDFNLLGLAGVVVLLLNPADLFHLGCQLSFLALATLVIFKDWIFPEPSPDPVERLIRNTRPWYVRKIRHFTNRCRQAAIVSFVIWVFGLPLIASNFHLVTPIAIIVNPILILPITIGLYAGVAVLVFGGWFPAVGLFLGTVSAVSLNCVAKVIEVADQLDAGHWWTAGPSGTSVTVFYVVVLVICLVSRIHRARLLLCWFAVWVGFGWVIPFQIEQWHSDRFDISGSCTVIDVGHGAAVLLQLPYGKNVLYDAGSLSSSVFAAESVSNLLWSQQVEHLDAVIVSHDDLDHFNALPELSKRFSIGVVYLGAPMYRDPSASCRELLKLLRRQHIEVRPLARGNSVAWSSTRMQVLMPPGLGTQDGDNSNSVVMLVQVGDQKLLLPGDLEGCGMSMLMQNEKMNCDIAMLPHHGSSNSRPLEFVQWCQPTMAIVSSGRNRFDGTISNRLMKTGCPIWVTAELGTLRFLLNSERRIQHFDGDRWIEIPRPGQHR